jgi:hypothetical protein
MRLVSHSKGGKGLRIRAGYVQIRTSLDAKNLLGPEDAVAAASTA